MRIIYFFPLAALFIKCQRTSRVEAATSEKREDKKPEVRFLQCGDMCLKLALSEKEH